MGLILFVYATSISPDRTSSSTLKLLRSSLTRLLTGNVSFQDADQNIYAAWVWAVTYRCSHRQEGLKRECCRATDKDVEALSTGLKAPKQAHEVFEPFFHEEELVVSDANMSNKRRQARTIELSMCSSLSLYQRGHAIN